MQRRMKRRRLRRFALGLAIVLGAAVGLREIVNANRFQLFGEAIARAETAERVVALSFDDGPHPVYTPQVLDVLDRHRVKATFFMLGRSVERHPDVARAVIARGHEVGNHSYSHPRMVLMSPAAIREEIERTDQLLRSLGVTGDIHFRAPHLSKFLVLPYVLRQLGKVSVLADVDAEEWRRRSAEEMTADVLAGVRPGSIVMMHDTAGEATVRMADEVIAALAGRGFRFEPVGSLIGRPRKEPSMSTLMLQIVQARILSVVSMYYAAFFAISMAMLGRPSAR